MAEKKRCVRKGDREKLARKVEEKNPKMYVLELRVMECLGESITKVKHPWYHDHLDRRDLNTFHVSEKD